MCGISGILKTEGTVSRPEIAGLTDCLSHRGPDGHDYLMGGNYAIGHRRLAIIDPKGGKQPMSNEDQAIWITFNGEIYNYQELIPQLKAKGHKFKTNSDTEVIVHAYEEWGEECVNKLRGMFAFAIVDQKKQQFFLARDHLGIKPLVYFHDNHQFVFASEIQALKSYLDSELSLNLKAIDLYLYLQYIPAPVTAYNEIHKLPPAHYLIVGFDGHQKALKKFWQLEYLVDDSQSEGDWLAQLDQVLGDSVQKHLVSDVPFGAFLSGGIDSTTIVGYMSRLLKHKVQTFNIAFTEQEYDESQYAKQASQHWGTDHHTQLVKPDAIELLPNLVKHYGEPFGDSSAIPTYYVSKLARNHVTMVLSGDGGDEMFAGYDTYQLWLRTLGRDQSVVQKLFGTKSFPQESLDVWLLCVAYMQNAKRQDLWQDQYAPNMQPEPEIFREVYQRSLSYDSVKKVQNLDVNTYLPFDILTKVDIASMMNSLEVRTPIVDYKVAEFAASIPTKFNLQKISGKWQAKLLLKKLLARDLGTDFANRPKMGFAVPVQKWLAPGGELYKYLRETLLDPAAHINRLFKPQEVASIVNGVSGGNKWQLLFLEEWLRQNKII